MTETTVTAPDAAPGIETLTDGARGAYERHTASLRASRPVPATGWSPPFEALGPRVQAAWLDVARPDAERIAELTAERDKAYGERADLVAFIAAAHTDAVIAYQDDDDDEWPVVIIETRAGQLSWHIAKADLGLFQAIGVPVVVGESRWDGHDTPEKYRRLAELTKAVGMSAPAEWAGAAGSARDALDAQTLHDSPGSDL
jgi:hypothetical protein